MNDDQDIERIKDDIENTRQRISGEIEAIGERLSPEHAKQVAKETIVNAKDKVIGEVKSSARRVAHAASGTPAQLGTAIRANPIPTAMVCAGTGWLLWNAFSRARVQRGPQMELAWEPDIDFDLERHEDRTSGLGTRTKERVNGARERVNHLAHSAASRTKDAASRTRERAGELARVGRERAAAVRVRSEDAYQTNPMVFGAAALVAGFGIAMLLPRTERESLLMGERRDQLVSKARERAKEAAVGSMRAASKVAKEELDPRS